MSIKNLLTGDKPLFSKPITYRIMLIFQAIFGLLWLEAASWKIIVDGKLALNYDGLAYWISRGSEYPVFQPYAQIIDNFILPNIEFFLIAVFVTELVTGLLFVAGKFIRVASVLAFSQTIFISLSVLNTPKEWKWSYFLMMLVSAIFFVMPTTAYWLNRVWPGDKNSSPSKHKSS